MELRDCVDNKEHSWLPWQVNTYRIYDEGESIGSDKFHDRTLATRKCASCGEVEVGEPSRAQEQIA